MEWAFVHKIWEKSISSNVGSGQPLKAALLLNYDPNAPSRLMSTIKYWLSMGPFRLVKDVLIDSLKACVYACSAEQEGIMADPTEMCELISFVKRNKLQKESFVIGQNQYLVTSIHESWFCARSMSTSKPAGEGAILMQTGAFFLIGLYDGSIGSASRAMVVLDQFSWQLNRRNH
ncbi:hypothetical protein H5410_042796 [Solanum commersonii]|uniref:Uncharacterized protein n=1 Tax=Solanum commersonii TaxID=4109 RepID=A0A9J5XX13_SOLCO|nr:hypothetical protein H5410_042796 [Solanum commersonii]